MFSLPKQVQQQNVIFCYQNFVTKTHYLLPNFGSKMYYFTNKNLVAHKLSGKIFRFPPTLLQNDIFCYQNLIAETYILLPNFGSKIQYFVTKKFWQQMTLGGHGPKFFYYQNVFGSKMYDYATKIWQRKYIFHYQNFIWQQLILAGKILASRQFLLLPNNFGSKIL